VTLTNTTLSGNSATILGGGAYLQSYTQYNEPPFATITNSTITANSAGNTGGGLWIDEYGGFSYVNVVLSNTIVSFNYDGGDCAGTEPRDDGNNFDWDSTCGAGFGYAYPGTDFAATLADNGGLTLTHALLVGSSAIDVGGSCGLDTDQRGQARDDGACDSGAYELTCPISVALVGGQTEVTFHPETDGFDLATGALADLTADGDFSNVTCLGAFTASPYIDGMPDPLPGEGHYYLARGRTNCAGSLWGSSTLVPDPRDVLPCVPDPGADE